MEIEGDIPYILKSLKVFSKEVNKTFPTEKPSTIKLYYPAIAASRFNLKYFEDPHVTLEDARTMEIDANCQLVQVFRKHSIQYYSWNVEGGTLVNLTKVQSFDDWMNELKQHAFYRGALYTPKDILSNPAKMCTDQIKSAFEQRTFAKKIGVLLNLVAALHDVILLGYDVCGLQSQAEPPYVRAREFHEDKADVETICASTYFLMVTNAIPDMPDPQIRDIYYEQCVKSHLKAREGFFVNIVNSLKKIRKEHYANLLKEVGWRIWMLHEYPPIKAPVKPATTDRSLKAAFMKDLSDQQYILRDNPRKLIKPTSRATEED